MQKTDFNRDWTVQKDGSNEILHVNLPDDAMIREERSKENKTASASAYFAGGKYIYTKIFDLSENETRQTLILEFEAVYQNATVFLNGRQVAEHPYGYTNFFVDITGYHVKNLDQKIFLDICLICKPVLAELVFL